MLDKNKFLGRMVMAGFSQRSLAKATGISKKILNTKPSVFAFTALIVIIDLPTYQNSA